MKGKKEKGKNFMWNPSMERLMLQILAEEAKQGNKPSNTFKASSYERVAKAINMKFNVECTTEHVDNRLKTVKKSWNTITTLKGKSGFGWDATLKMIKVGENEYDEEILAHPTHEKYLNKKIEMYDEMSIVVGRDMATGSFAKSLTDIDAAENEVNSINIEDESFEEGTIGKATSSCPISKPQRKRSRSSASFDDYVEKVSGQLGELTKAIDNLGQNQLNVDKLYGEVMKMEAEGFVRSLLSNAFDYLVENVNQAKAFIAKDDDLKKVWLANFFQQKENN